MQPSSGHSDPRGAHRPSARTRVATLALVAGSASLLLAQQPPPQPPIFRAGVGAVRIDVTVIGRDGLPVADLTRDDFEVREDDAVQRIQVFEHRTLTGYPTRDDESLAIRSADHARQEAGREEVRLLVLFLDDYHIRFGPLEDHQLRQRLVRFVTTEMRPLDLFAVMGPLTPISDLGLTRDKAALLRRINTLQGRLGGFVPPRSKVEEAHLSLGGANLARVRAQVSMSALESLAVHLGSLREGRKSVLFVSQGPAMSIGGYDMSEELREVVAAANRNNVTIHTLDPRELGQASMISEINNALSIDTGGRRIGLTNDFSPALRGVMSDASDYYLLGYESPQVKPDGKFHDIDVRVRRKGVRVIARNGYWSPSPDEASTATAAAAAPPIPPEVSDALGALRDAARRISVLDWLGVSPLEQGESRVSIIFEPATADPKLAPASVHVDVTLPGGATATHVARPAAEGAWQLEVTSPPGRLTVRPTVRDRSGEVIDTWSRTAVVPAAESVASRVGTPIVLRARTVLQYRALRAGDAVPAAGRRFRRGDRVLVRLPMLAGDRPAVEVQLLNRQGTALQTLAAVSQASAADVELPLGNLAQADYLVRFNVGVGDGATTTLVPFSLVP